MKSAKIFLSLVGLSLVGGLAIAGGPSESALFLRASEPVRDRYIIRLRDTRVAPSQVPAVAVELASRSRGRLIAHFSNGVRGFAIEASEQQALGLAHDPRVELIEEAAIVHLSATDTFPLGQYWHLDRIDQRSVLPPPGVPGTGSYNWVSDGSGVDVYIVDTGIKPQHSEFTAGQVTPGVNYAGLDLWYPDPDTQWAPTNPCGDWEHHYNGGHGTAVASLVGGRYTGVAKGTRLIPVKTFSCNPDEIPGGIAGFDTVGVMWATNWILGEAQTSGRRSVVNMSFYYWSNQVCTVPPPCDPQTDPDHCEHNCATSLESNIYDLLTTDTDPNADGTQGVVVVTSANNQDDDYCFPTPEHNNRTQSPSRMGYGGMYDSGSPSQPLVITVGGTQRVGDERYWFEQGDGSNVGACVDIYAPAQVIHSAHLAGPYAYRDTYPVSPWTNTAEWYSSGTSFAAPIVSGVAARLLQRHPTYTVRQIWDEMYAAATPITTHDGNFDGDGIARNNRLVYMAGSE